MGDPFIGSEMLASGRVTRHQLRTRFVAIHQDVYIERGVRPTAVLRAKAAWLRSRRHGVLAGYSAAALHGARYIDPGLPANIIDTNRRAARGIAVWADAIEEADICPIGEMRVTTPLRTALDLARRVDEDAAVVIIDALARAARLKVADIELTAERFEGCKGIKKARKTIGLVNPGAESPQESRLRLLIVRAGFPPPETQYPIFNEYGALIGEADMAWPGLKIAVEYEGRHHTEPDQLRKDIARMDEMMEMGWMVIRITARDTPAVTLRKISRAWTLRS